MLYSRGFSLVLFLLSVLPSSVMGVGSLAGPYGGSWVPRAGAAGARQTHLPPLPIEAPTYAPPTGIATPMPPTQHGSLSDMTASLLRGSDVDDIGPVFPAFEHDTGVLVCPRRCGFCCIDSAGATKEQLLAGHLCSCRADSTHDPTQLPDHLEPVTGAQEDNVFRTGGSNLIEQQDGVYLRRCPRGCGAKFSVDTEEGRVAYANHLMGAVEGEGAPQGGCRHDLLDSHCWDEELYVEAWTKGKVPPAYSNSGNVFRMSGHVTNPPTTADDAGFLDAYFCTGVNTGPPHSAARPTLEKPMSEEETAYFKNFPDRQEYEWSSHAKWTHDQASSLDTSHALHAFQGLLEAHIHRAMGSLYDANEKPADLLKEDWLNEESGYLLDECFDQYHRDVDSRAGQETSRKLSESGQFYRLMELVTREEHVERFRGAAVAGRRRNRVWISPGNTKLESDLFLPESEKEGTVLLYITRDGQIWESPEQIFAEVGVATPEDSHDPPVDLDVLILGYYKTPVDRATRPLWYAPEPKKTLVRVGGKLDTVTEKTMPGPDSWRPFSSWYRNRIKNPALDYPGVFHIRATGSFGETNMVKEVAKMVTASLNNPAVVVEHSAGVRAVLEASIQIEKIPVVGVVGGFDGDSTIDGGSVIGGALLRSAPPITEPRADEPIVAEQIARERVRSNWAELGKSERYKRYQLREQAVELEIERRRALERDCGRWFGFPGKTLVSERIKGFLGRDD